MNDEALARLAKVESNMAHLEHQVEQLNGVVIAQGKMLEQLKKQSLRQSATLETMELERIKTNNLKPPHH